MGGATQIERMNKDKLRSLKKALLYSYQAATAQLSDGREFRCLINPNKLSLDLDNKIISIPFRDICLNIGSIDIDFNESLEGVWEEMEDLVATLVLADTQSDDWEDMVEKDEVETLPEEDVSNNPHEEMDINIQEGDVICWKENGSHWIVYLRRLEETAYFRADIRRCRYELTLGNGSKYWAYVRGPVEQSILWTQTSGNYFNKLNYSLVIYIQQNEETMKYFNRFKKVMINNQPWEVQSVDSISTPGIIEMTLKETYNNTIENNIEKAVEKAKQKEKNEEQNNEVYIYVSDIVYPYDICKYEIKNYNGSETAYWQINNQSKNKIIKIIDNTNKSIELHILSGKSGSFVLEYIDENKVIISKNIKIGSL